jgi:(p)ppGpp synthase/HD superfamily hydrolase
MSVTDARELAVRVHGDQRDRDCSFHIDHVARVAQSVADDHAYQRVAWLHDVIEDSDLAPEDLDGRLVPESGVGSVLYGAMKASARHSSVRHRAAGSRLT